MISPSSKPLLFRAAIALALTPVVTGCSSEPEQPLDAARIAFAEANPRTALDLASAAIDADPTDLEAKLLAAEIAMALDNPDRAISELERVVESDSAPHNAKAKLVEAYVAGNFLSKARNMVDSLSYDHAHAFIAAISLELAEGELQAAFDRLDQGLADFPKHPRLITIDAERMLMLAQTKDAAARLAEVFAGETPVAEAHMLAGRMHLADSELDEAEAQFETALTMRPTHQASMLAMAAIARDRDDEKSAVNWINKANAAGQPHPVGLLFAAQMAYDAGDIERAYVLVEKAPPSFKRQPQFARLRGFVDAARGEHKLAINALQDYIESTGGDPLARRVLAQSLASADRFDEAWDAISPLIGHPRTDGGTLLLALQLANKTGLGDPERIEQLMRQRDAAPDFATALREAGQAINAGRWAEADAIYAPYLVDAGLNDPILLNNAAAVKSKLGEHDEAIALARRAITAAPGTPEILDTLGWALWQAGENPDEARALLAQARAAKPRDRTIGEHWAIAHAES